VGTDLGQDTIHICQNITIPEAQHAKPFGFKKQISVMVIFSLIMMLHAIRFDNQFAFQTDEIRNVRPNPCLPTKFCPFNLSVAEGVPKAALGNRHALAEFFVSLGNGMVRRLFHTSHPSAACAAPSLSPEGRGG